VNRLPDPPPAGELRRIRAAIHTARAGTLFWRIYFQGGAHPGAWNAFRRFGPTQSRFDHHRPPPRAQSRAILYAAAQAPTCFAEVFQETGEIDVRSGTPALVAFETVRPLALLDLRGVWPTRAGGSMAINAGDRRRSRLWSRAIHDAYPAVQGLWYGSSMDANLPAVALYERAARALPRSPAFHRHLADPTVAVVVAQAAARFDFDVR
jgi:hypothetical protein